ncbi:MAG: biosynthetic peptidoglycan transglycosylase [Arcicella sp.]|nr:biosynthetic peptidoglycan transglycosylase [Arcicella sp.]
MDKIKQLIQNLGDTIGAVIRSALHWLWVQLDNLLVMILGEQKVADFYKRLDIVKESYWITKAKVSSVVEQQIDKDSLYYRRIKRLWKIFAWTVFAGAFYIFSIHTNFLWLTGEMPSVGELQNPKLSQSSEIYSADGVLMGKYFLENRTPVNNYSELSPYLTQALVSTEDSRFYQHSGIDFRAIFGVAAGILTGASERGGGSTITQQLAKNLFKTRKKEGLAKKGLFGYVPGLKTLVIKTKEWITAIKLERYYTKEEIILWYLNTVDFGSNAYGIKVAAKTYFNTSPDSLNVQESAVLVGMQKATNTYNPRRNYDKSLRSIEILFYQEW